MKLVFLDAATMGSDADLSVFERFGELVCYEATDKTQTATRLQGAQIVLTNKVVITRELMQNSKLKLICVTATGTNNVDLEAAKELGIAVKNVAGYSTNSVIQQTFANLLSLKNHTHYYDEYCKSAQGWASSEIFVHLDKPVFELSGKSFGVVGLGEIGRGVARVARAFGCEVCYYSTSGKNANDEFAQVSFDELLKCDIISIHAPLNDSTKGLFDAAAIARLKDGAVLGNYGRGGIVDEEAIAREIDKREIYFATDVLQSEPMVKNHPFLSVARKDRLLLSPHIGWASVEARERLLRLVVKNIEDFLAT